MKREKRGKKVRRHAHVHSQVLQSECPFPLPKSSALQSECPHNSQGWKYMYLSAKFHWATLARNVGSRMIPHDHSCSMELHIVWILQDTSSHSGQSECTVSITASRERWQSEQNKPPPLSFLCCRWGPIFLGVCVYCCLSIHLPMHKPFSFVLLWWFILWRRERKRTNEKKG